MGSVFDSLEDVDISGDIFVSPPPVGPEGVLHGKLANGMTYVGRGAGGLPN